VAFLQNPLYFFVFLPGIACLILGSVCLCIGFIALFNIRRAFKRDRSLYASNHSNGDNGSSHFDQRASIAKLEALMMKIGMFSIGYVIPAGVVLACIYYSARGKKLLGGGVKKMFVKKCLSKN